MSNDKPLYADIIPFRRMPATMSFLTYSVPDESASVLPGQIVSVPFRSSIQFGVVLRVHNKTPPYDTKQISQTEEIQPSWTQAHLDVLCDFAQRFHVSNATFLSFFAPQIPKKITKKAGAPEEHLLTLPDYAHVDVSFEETPDSHERIAVQYQHLGEKLAGYASLCATSNGQTLILCPQEQDAREIFSYLKYKGHSPFLWHGRPQSKQRQWEAWNQAKGASITIATRSGALLPLQNLKRIIIDQEEQDEHKQWDASPYYDARDLATELAKKLDIPTHAFSHAPRSATAHASKLKRTSSTPHPMHTYLHDTSEPLLHESLLGHMKEEQASGKHTILITSHKASARAIHCLDCHYQAPCQACGVNLRVQQDRLICPQCFTQKDIPLSCPECKGQRFKHYGLGTKGLASYLAGENLSVKTIDAAAFDNLELPSPPCVFLSTPGLLKRLYYHGLTSAGSVILLHPESVLFSPDYRANELFYQSLNRQRNIIGDYFKADCLIQTRLQEDDHLLSLATTNDLQTFLREELAQRKRFHYPPYARIIRLLLKRGDKHFSDQADQISSAVKDLRDAETRVSGPFFQREQNEVLSAHWDIRTSQGLAELHLDRKLNSLYSKLLIDINPLS